MIYSNDPEVAAAMAERSARASLWRTVLLWGPLFLAAFGGFLFFTYDEATGGDRGSWFLVGVLALLSLLLGVHAGQSLRDLFTSPRELTGIVVRRWSRTDSFVVRSHYIRVAGKIFRIDRLKHGDFEPGDFVWVRYYPHSATVISIEKRDLPDETAGTGDSGNGS